MLRHAYDLLKETASNWVDDNASSRGAALAYYSMFAIAPIVILTVSVAGLFLGDAAASGQVAEQLRSTVGPQVAGAIEAVVRNASNPSTSKWAALVGLLVALLGAAGVYAELQSDLNAIWKVTPRPGRPIWNVVKERVFSFGMVLASGFLLLVSLVVTATLNSLAHFITPASLPGGVLLWQTINALVSFAFVGLLFALIFKFVPDVHVPWADVWRGAALTALLFTIGKYLLAIYVTRTSVASAYGAAGSLVVVLVWVYYSAQILLFGAEFTRGEARRHGSRCAPAHDAWLTPSGERGALAPR